MPDPITNGHIDGLLAFSEPDEVLLHTTADRGDINYRVCEDTKRVPKPARYEWTLSGGH